MVAIILGTCYAWAGGGLDPTGKEEKGATLESVLDLESISPSDEGVVQIELPGIGARDFMTRFVGDTLFVPYMTFCDFLRIPNNVSPDYLRIGGQMPVGQNFEISRLSSTAHTARTDLVLPPTAIRVAGGEVYVEQSFLMKVLGLTAIFDTNDLKLRIVPDEKIPAVQFQKNNEKYANLAFEDDQNPMMPVADVERNLFGNPVIDWSVTHQTVASTNATAGSFRLGTEFLFGTLEVNTTANMVNFNPHTFKNQVNNWNWRYFTPQSSIVKQIGIGQLAVNDKQYFAAQVSNVPLTPRSGFAVHDLRGQTQPGWTVELYDGPRLVDVTTADSSGRFLFHVPVGYGTVDRLLRYVGPYGEVSTEERRIQLNTQMVPEGEFDYTAKFGFKDLDLRSPLASEFHGEFGMAEWISIGAEGALASANFKSISQDSIQGAVFTNLWLGDAHSVTARYSIRDRKFSAEYYTMTTDGLSVRGTIDSLTMNLQSFTAQGVVSLPAGDYTPGLLMRVAKGPWGYLPELDPTLTASVFGFNLIGSVRMLFPTIKTPYSIIDPMVERRFSAYGTLRVLKPLFSGWVATAELNYNQLRSTLESFDAGLYMRVLNNIGLNLGVTFHDLDFGHLSMKDLRNAGLRMQVDFDFDQTKVTAFGGRDGGNMSANFQAQGSAMISPVGIMASRNFGLGQSAIMIKPFRDANQNGVHDPGEEFLAPMVATLSQGHTQYTSTDGSFTSLPANTQWTLEVDRWTFAEDGLFPNKTRYPIFTTPSSMQVIEVACVEGFDVMGSCKVDDGSTGTGKKQDFGGLLNGLRLQLVSAATGAAFDGEIFSDGSIFIPGVCAGEYRIIFDQNQLASRRLSILTMSDVVTLSSDGHRIPTIILQRTAR